MATYLLDKSAWARRDTRPEVFEAFDGLLWDGEVATCEIANLEVLYSARGPRDYETAAAALDKLPQAQVTNRVVQRALEVQRQLAEKSQHRSVDVPDLLIAACAEISGLTVLHYDSDYDRIAKFTGQPTKWVVQRGSVD